MVVPIPYARTFTTSMTGEVVVQAICEQCRHGYAYRLKRQTHGEATSWLFINEQGAREKAETQAQAELARKLSTEVDGVPCPQCGTFQTDMIPVLRLAYHGWMRGLAKFLIFGCVASLLFYFVLSRSQSLTQEITNRMNSCLMTALGSAVLAVLLFSVRTIVSRRFDPNDPGRLHARLRLAQQRCVPLPEEPESHVGKKDVDRLAAPRTAEGDDAFTDSPTRHTMKRDMG